MGCGSSTVNAVRPLTPGEVNANEDETGSKLSGRGDSAVSKGTTDSGVVMENREIPLLPGAMPRKLPPLTFESARESEAHGITQADLLWQDIKVTERQKSSDILEELLNQGIIPKEQPRKQGSGPGEAYSIMLDDSEGIRRRPPARLESLKAKKAQRLHSREKLEEKLRLAEERRKLKEDELKTRLRAKSARVRIPTTISSTEEEEDTLLTPVEPLESPHTPELTPALPHHSQMAREAAEGEEWVREGSGDGRECEEEVENVDKKERQEKGGDNAGESAKKTGEDGEKEEELTPVEELIVGQFLSSLGELESDSSFQHTENKQKIF